MVGNVITINSLYQNILDAVEANQTGQVWFYIGRICNILVEIEPIVIPTLRASIAEPTKLQTPLDTLLYALFSQDEF